VCQPGRAGGVLHMCAARVQGRVIVRVQVRTSCMRAHSVFDTKARVYVRAGTYVYVCCYDSWHDIRHTSSAKLHANRPASGGPQPLPSAVGFARSFAGGAANRQLSCTTHRHKTGVVVVSKAKALSMCLICFRRASMSSSLAVAVIDTF
jgi:hypothetical protein